MDPSDFVVFGRQGCPYCEASKKMLRENNKNITYKYYDINTDAKKINNNPELAALYSRGRMISSTVPKVFVRKDKNLDGTKATDYQFKGGSVELRQLLK